MKIAIVAPLSQPWMIGGAEKLWWGLLQHFNQETQHQADLVKLPSPEGDFWALLGSYARFASLRLEGFDLVVSTKYPAWMVSHPNHTVYLQHRVRGLYDAYPGKIALPPEMAGIPAVARLRRFMQESAGQREALDDFFALAFAMRNTGAEAAVGYPGPLTREVVHYLDGIALTRKRIRRFGAIARTVAERDDYFPAGAEVTIAHHPSNLVPVPGERFDYFFTVSRLDGPKRLGLLVEAMRHVRANVKLLIAGTGPDEQRLREMAKDDGRVKFLGFRTDAEVAALYRDALAVPFVPWKEDYGLITVEAMAAGKPVITVTDAGGPTEVVQDGRNGFIVESNAKAIGAAMDRFAADPELARRMGREGIATAAAITWSRVSDFMVGAGEAPEAATQPRRKLVVLVTFPIFPIIHGGMSRAFNLYRHFAEHHDVTIVAVDDFGRAARDETIAPHMRQVVVPRSEEHERAQGEIQQLLGIPVADIVLPSMHAKTPGIAQAIREAVHDADTVILCHPYLLPALEEFGWRGPVWYEAQDCEIELKRQTIRNGAAAGPWFEAIERVERAALERADLSYVCSDADADALVRLYGVGRERLFVVPNGTDLPAIRYCGPEMRALLRRRLGVAKGHYALFVGSGHPPNIDAVTSIFATSAQMPETTFLVAGNVCYAFDPTLVPKNVLLLGMVDDATRNVLLEFAHVALNPIRHGSGTNLKMLDYFAAGIPVLSSTVGVRGLGVEEGEHVFIAEPQDTAAGLARVFAADTETLGAMTARARRLVESKYDWKAIADAALAHLQKGSDSFPPKGI